ncbi:MAG: hypothetical protein Hyperionvirus24_8 [Hyperionvirus sp.]|uniref:Primase C-terminal 2 domain-containing protein n=1 Tax=Hyperionvirus sp. TaxID=2487770 RepID=A0A3G5AAY3_9VIRU|nr:MAG: hypothetical protein Hyperionvirus24_8 [Hyperionvirus sp.]
MQTNQKFTVFKIKRYLVATGKFIRTKGEDYGLAEVIELLERENKGYHMRIHNKTNYKFFGDCDKYPKGIDRLIGLLIKFLDERYNIKVTAEDIFYTENKSVNGSYHYVIPSYHASCEKIKEIHTNFLNEYWDEFTYKQMVKGVETTKKNVDTGIYAEKWFRCPNQSKEGVAGTEHRIVKGSMKDFIVDFIEPDKSVCIEDRKFIAGPVVEISKSFGSIPEEAFIPIFKDRKEPAMECHWRNIMSEVERLAGGELWVDKTREDRNRIRASYSNVGMVTGKKYDIWVLKVNPLTEKDQRKGVKDGLEFYQNLLKVHNGGTALKTVTVLDPNGGKQIFFRWNKKIKNGAKFINNYSIEMKGNGAYIICPLSSFEGEFYNYEAGLCPDDVEIIECPEWLLNLLVEYNTQKNMIDRETKKKAVILHLNKECVSLERLKKYLRALNKERADSYDMWIKVLTCVRICNPDGFDLADEWSQVSGKYVSRDDVFKHWKTLKTDLNMGFGTLIEFIKQDNAGDKYIISKLDYVEYEAITPRYCKINEKMIDAKYLTSKIYKESDIVVCKSGTGTRKSASAAVCCNEEGGKVFVLGSLVTLIDQEMRCFSSEYIVEQFGKNHISLVKYNDEDLDIKNDRGFATTLNSLYKFEKLTNKELEEFTVVIDEANSVMTYLLGGGTVARQCIYVYSLLKRILVNCKKIIMIDADISDIVFEFLNFIMKLRTKNNKAIFVRNVRKNYSGIKAIKVNKKELIKRMKQDIAMGVYFVACFDSKTQAKKLFDMMSDKQNKNKFILICGDSGDEVDPEKWHEKWIFYSPKVIYGVDYIPKNLLAETVYVLATGVSITPLQANQQTTRNRIIKKVIYCITAKPKKLKYETVDALEKDEEGVNAIMKKLMKGPSVDIVDFNRNRNIAEDVQEFRKLLCIAEYHKNIFAVDFCRHFETILLGKGFEIEREGDCDEDMTVKEENELVEENIPKAMERGTFMDWVEGKSDDKVFNELMTFFTRDVLKLPRDREILLKFEKPICKIGSHYNLISLLRGESYVKQITEEHVFDRVKMKILLTRRLEELLEIESFDLDTTKHEGKFDNEISMSDAVYKTYIKLYRGKRAKPTTWKGGYSMLMKSYLSLTKGLDIFDSFPKTKWIKKKATKITYYVVNSENIKLNLQLLKFRGGKEMVGISDRFLDEEMKACRSEKIDNNVYMFGEEKGIQRTLAEMNYFLKMIKEYSDDRKQIGKEKFDVECEITCVRFVTRDEVEWLRNYQILGDRALGM